MLTPKSVIPSAAPEDPELVIVVCEDENGSVHNHYIRDAALKTALVTADTARAAAVAALQQQHDTDRLAEHAIVLTRGAAEIAAADAAKTVEEPA